jgi:hypothetical protein
MGLAPACGVRAQGEGVHGLSHSQGAGVAGFNDSGKGGPGVYGEASKNGGEGVHGIGHTAGAAAVGGVNSSGGPGVWGVSVSGIRVRGTSHVQAAGVFGENDSGAGDPKQQQGGPGMLGTSSNWAARPSARWRLLFCQTPSWGGTEGSSPANSMGRVYASSPGQAANQ